MAARINKLILCIILAAAAFMASAAHALIVTEGGVDTVARHFVIDSTESSVTHDPGMVFDESVPQTYAISGEFDASFSNYWWTYYVDGDIDGTQGALIYQETWLRFSNEAIVGSAGLQGFVFPNYFARVTGATISGDDGACTIPLGPNSYCSGSTNFPFASMTGAFEDGVLTLQGSVPVVGGNLFEYFSYSIRANAVPEPGTLALILFGTVGVFVSARRRHPR